MPHEPLDVQALHEMSSAFMPACVIGAAAELDLFTRLGQESLSADQISRRLDSDLRATTMLLDAAAALGLLEKHQGRYTVPEALRPLLSAHGPQTVLPMLQHRMNVLRSWALLPWVVRAGIPGPRTASIRGPAADRAAFVAAMHSAGAPVADQLVARLGLAPFGHLLDVGGASGTWTLALLRIAPEATATIFDLPDAIQQARERIERSEFAARIRLVAGDFYVDELPAGADLAWLSAIAHQHSRQHNRELFAKVFRALEPGGTIAIRDVLMQPDRTRPVQGALFAINMLVNTETGGTFTFEEFAQDLEAAGFRDVRLVIHAEDMNSVLIATKA